ncbi:MAG: SET domain-containing protein-lysine N-methyltransferase [bacterium]
MTPVVVRRAKNGVGLFAARSYRPKQTIIKIVGRIVDAGVLWDTGGTFSDNCFRFGPETYLDPGDELGRYLNHSCEPNAGIRKSKNQLYLFAVDAIGPGREIVIDYSTILGDDDIWTMRCECGRRTCRKKIRRFGSLGPALKERYVERGLVPKYIIKTLSRQ